MTRKKHKPNPAASDAARALAEARWANVPREERVRLMTEMGRKGGRPKSKRRCFCGEYTMRRAASKNFDCCRRAGVITLTEPTN